MAQAQQVDPLIRLQMARVNTQIPGAFHPGVAAYANLLAGGRPPPSFDPRFRTPGPADTGCHKTSTTTKATPIKNILI